MRVRVRKRSAAITLVLAGSAGLGGCGSPVEQRDAYRSVGFEAFGTEPMAILTPGGFGAKVHMQRVIESGSAAAQPLA